MSTNQVEAIHSRPPSRAAVTVNTAGMTKLEVRRIQMLARERDRLEEEMATLQKEVDELELEDMKR